VCYVCAGCVMSMRVLCVLCVCVLCVLCVFVVCAVCQNIFGVTSFLVIFEIFWPGARSEYQFS